MKRLKNLKQSMVIDKYRVRNLNSEAGVLVVFSSD